ncbi:hypothetical protein ACQP1P_33325 [Dactylosporangium sp. CA-052675]|uniref:hypothetical protein n=1 Tax=Dactylosporangium sp. CA-052675 TaxID=3239927 RepID=UPI003D8B9D19
MRRFADETILAVGRLMLAAAALECVSWPGSELIRQAAVFAVRGTVASGALGFGFGVNGVDLFGGPD